MSQVVETEVRDIVLSNGAFGPKEIERLANAVHEDYIQFGVLRDSVAELESREDRTPAAAVRLGVCYYLLGRYQRAQETLSKADGGALAHYYLGKALFSLGDYAHAIKAYEAAKKAGYNADDCALGVAEAKRHSGDAAAAMAVLDGLFGPVEQTAEYLYQRACTVSAVGGNPQEVTALLERAYQADGRHAGALFGLGLANDRHGNDEAAMDLYQKAANCFPTHVGALLNLGILYEDREEYSRAQACYQRILDSYPGHPRASLFLKDAAASRDMFYDEEDRKRRDHLAQLLNVSVGDFELSVRSRNCLQKMGVRTLGDLTRTTEQELLSSKNFGETSLIEIRDMLASKGLALGQFAHQKPDLEPAYDNSFMSPDEAAVLDRNISELNLSVRARKCMARLQLNTIGDLIRKTGDELLECKNFGVTSLNEVREKLSQFGVKLKGD